MRTKRAFFIIFKELSLKQTKQILSEGESSTLILPVTILEEERTLTLNFKYVNLGNQLHYKKYNQKL